jgi:uncharacterized protein
VIRVLTAVLLMLAACGRPATSAPTTAAAAGYDFPALTGRVVDRAGILPAADEARIGAKVEALDRATGHQIVIVTIPNLGGHAIEDYSLALGNRWGIGRKRADDGVLLVVAPTERKVRIEVGKGLEATLTNAEAQRIIDTDILPAFRAGDFARGIDNGVDGVIRDVGPAGGGA